MESEHRTLSRRRFLSTTATGSLAVGTLIAGKAPDGYAAETARPALLGGTPVHTGGWARWPQWQADWEPELLDVFRSGRWFRGAGGWVAEFETRYANLLGARSCLATSSGTTALIVSLNVMDVDAGDEVIVSPYTFIATYNAILNRKALPVFADTDPATLTLDPATLEGRITDRTRAILPVHIFGMPCDMDAINAVARKHQLAVVEDACQAWMAEYRGRKCGTLGDLGCFSFQESKHLPSGEGGAVTGMDAALVDRCHSFHNCGRAFGSHQGNGYFTRGENYRLTQIQARLLLLQIDKLARETALRQARADHLTRRLEGLPGITPVRLPSDSRAVWHLYPFRYDPARFGSLTRDQFLRALSAEGIPCSAVYHEQYHDGLLDEAIASRGFQRLWSRERLKAYRDSFQELKGNRQVCQTTVAVPQTVLLADPDVLDRIPEAIRRVHAHAPALARALG